MKRLIYLLFSLSIIAASCTRNDIDYTRVYSGSLYSKVDSLPFKNTSVDIYSVKTSLGFPPEIDKLTNFTTDSFGNFSVSFDAGTMDALYLKWPRSARWDAGFYGNMEAESMPTLGRIYTYP